MLILPQSVESVKDIAEKFSSASSRNELAGTNAFFGLVFDLGKKIYDFLTERFAEYVPAVLEQVTDIFTGAYNVLFGAFIGLLMLACRDGVKRQFKHTVLLALPEEKAEKVFSFLRKVSSKVASNLNQKI